MTAAAAARDAAAPGSGRPAVSFGDATRTWLRIGLLSFGGPAGQIALMHRILVDEKRWIGEAQFLHALNFCMLLPGPEAQQLATYVGWLLHGNRGGLVAGTLFVAPGFLVVVALSAVYVTFQGVPLVEGVFFGLKAAVLAIVVQALVRIGRRALAGTLAWALAAAAFVLIFALGAPFPLIVLGAAAIGYAAGRMRPDLLRGGGHGVGADDEPVLPSAAPTVARSLNVLAIGAAAWAGPIVAVTVLFGADSVFPAIGALFSKLAVVTFGGAYAVLAYVAQQAVQDLGWLAPGEMIDGLALAETTPGPLILVLTFVGFLASWRAPAGLDPMTAGLVGATLTTWVTFVPCFLWILLGAPYIERLRGHRALAGALSAITAAVVGVIANLVAWFAVHSVFGSVGTWSWGPLSLPAPHWATFDPAAALLAAGAMLAVFRFRLGIVPTLALSAGAGLLLRAAL